MLRSKIICCLLLSMLVVPTYAQTSEIHSFQLVLDDLYNDMLPLCEQLLGVGQGIAAFGAMWYIASRVYKHIASAEAIEFYPLLRPFALGLAIMLFPGVISLINGVLSPLVKGTASMVNNTQVAIDELLKRKEQALMETPAGQMFIGEGDYDLWYRYTHPGEGEEGVFEGISNSMRFAMAKAAFNFRYAIKQWLSEVLQLLFEAASLCINTIRTFYLIILAIIGPLVFALSVYDGFQHTLTVWLARYINVYLWLPVANIFGSIIGRIQENMLVIDLGQIDQGGQTFFSTADTAYLVFLIIGVAGYFTVPSVANYIVHASGVNSLLHKVSHVFIAAPIQIGGKAPQVIAGTTISPSPGNTRDYKSQKISG